jgi:membrane-bound inhibitor of C-type lysozyme
MKKTAFILFVSLAALLSCAGEQATPTEDEVTDVHFACDNGEEIEVRFFPARDLATLIRQGKSVDLKEQVSASGFIYSNGPITVRGKGKEIMVEIGRMTPLRCEAR